MKWRKTYQNWQERKSDRQKGIAAAVIMNALVLITPSSLGEWVQPTDNPTLNLVLQLLPWVANLGLLVVALIFRAEMAVGCLMAIASVLLTVFALGVAFVIGCFAWVAVTLAILFPLSLIEDMVGGGLHELSNFVGVLVNMVGFIVFLYIFLRLAIFWVGAIWSHYGSANSQDDKTP